MFHQVMNRYAGVVVVPSPFATTCFAALLVAVSGGCGTSASAIDASISDGAAGEVGVRDAETSDGDAPDSGVADAAVDDDAGTATNPLVEARPYAVRFPAGYDPEVASPVLLSLHGFTLDGATTMSQARLAALADTRGYILAYPDGTPDSMGRRFWNATNGCCNVEGIEVDDVAYLTAVLDDLERRFRVDPRRVFVFGFSNGGFMAHRFACEHGDRLAAIVSLGGVSWLDPSDCPAGHAVNVLQIHSDADEVIPYTGNAYLPSAAATVAMWMEKNGCTGALTSAGIANLDLAVAGDEASKQVAEGCPANGAVAFWTLDGSLHGPNLGGDWLGELGGYFDGHARAD